MEVKSCATEPLRPQWPTLSACRRGSAEEVFGRWLDDAADDPARGYGCST